MTKTEELSALDRMIAEFGPDSYIGPWLAEHRDCIVADLASDLPVAYMSPRQARQEAADIIAQAVSKAADIVAQATARDDAARLRTIEKIDAAKERARRDIIAIADRL